MRAHASDRNHMTRLARRCCLTAIILMVPTLPCQAHATPEGMTRSDAVTLAQAVLQGFGGTIGPTEVLYVDDIPRDPASVTPSSAIQVVVGDSRISPVPGVYSNCIADSALRVVRCDLRMLDDLLDEFPILNNERQRSSARMQILRLVLSHELGHIVLHHVAAEYHGSANGFSVIRYSRYKTELAADAYSVRLLDSSGLDLDHLYGTVVQLSYEAMRKSLCPETYPVNCPCPGYKSAALCSRIALGPGLPIVGDERFRITLTGTHPEFIIRFTRLLTLSTFPDAVAIYGREARQVLLRVRIKNERGKYESAKALSK